MILFTHCRDWFSEQVAAAAAATTGREQILGFNNNNNNCNSSKHKSRALLVFLRALQECDKEDTDAASCSLLTRFPPHSSPSRDGKRWGFWQRY